MNDADVFPSPGSPTSNLQVCQHASCYSTQAKATTSHNTYLKVSIFSGCVVSLAQCLRLGLFEDSHFVERWILQSKHPSSAQRGSLVESHLSFFKLIFEDIGDKNYCIDVPQPSSSPDLEPICRETKHLKDNRVSPLWMSLKGAVWGKTEWSRWVTQCVKIMWSYHKGNGALVSLTPTPSWLLFPSKGVLFLNEVFKMRECLSEPHSSPHASFSSPIDGWELAPSRYIKMKHSHIPTKTLDFKTHVECMCVQFGTFLMCLAGLWGTGLLKEDVSQPHRSHHSGFIPTTPYSNHITTASPVISISGSWHPQGTSSCKKQIHPPKL